MEQKIAAIFRQIDRGGTGAITKEELAAMHGGDSDGMLARISLMLRQDVELFVGALLNVGWGLLPCRSVFLKPCVVAPPLQHGHKPGRRDL